MQYVVRGASRESGAAVSLTIEARDFHHAEEQANDLGVMVNSVLPAQDEQPSTPARQEAASTAPDGDREQILWSGRPSQLSNVGTLVLCVLFCWLLVPILIAIWVVLKTRSTVMSLTNERLRLEWGVLGRRSDNVELYRVKDVGVEQSLVARIAGLGTVYLVTSDRTASRINLPYIHDAPSVAEKVRQVSERQRRAHRVREVDIA